MRVLLLEVRKLLFETSENRFEVLRNNNRLFTRPKLLDDLGKGDCQEALGPKRILVINFIDESSLQKVIRQSLAVTEALQSAVHVAAVG